MIHRICTSEADGGLPYFQRLWRTLLAPNLNPRTRLEQLFEHEAPEFGMDYAFLSSIDLENETEQFKIVHGSHDILKPGTTVPLSQTYCRKTIADPEGTMAVSDAPVEGWEDDPAYEAFELGSYLGTTISVDNELYGTLCFADTAVREEPINDKEKALLEMYGQWVEYILRLWDDPPIWEASFDTIERHTVSSEEIDSMMAALDSHSTRVVLMTLLGESPETSVGTLEGEINHENARIRLHHNYLPKLADAGYIEWDADSETVSKGPEFSKVEPLVQLLKEYNTTISE